MKSRFRPVIRVFVSSTFSDLKEERNVLQSEVFPRLENYCLVRGFQFQAIDLRWGVPGEAGLDHRTMRICFEELRRAQEVSPRPNFLVLLGDRYGWQPLAEEVTEIEFRELEKGAGQLDDEASRDKQAGESATQVLRTWYRRDENADPVTYTLRSRNEWPGGQPFAAEREDEAWKKVEAVLWAVINRAFPPEGLAGRFANIPGADAPLPSIVKFQASATEQEIWRGALAVPDAPEHVVAWYRTIRNRRDFLGDVRAKDFFDPKEALHVAAGELRDKLSRKLHKDGEEDIVPMHVDLRVSDDPTKLEVTRDHLKAMCDEIETKLVQIAEREIAAYWQPTGDTTATPTPKDTGGPSEARKLELEQQAHELFGESRAPKDGFVGRDKELAAIAKYLSDEDDRTPLVVYGPSGAGKTALLARAAQSAAGGGRRIIIRFLGTTPLSSNLRSLLANLCRALRKPGEIEKEVPAELRELQDEFDRLLALATEEKPILLFLDALDQLDEADAARQTYWLRAPLPPHVKVVVSCIYDPGGQEALNEPYHALERRKALDRAIAIESLTAAEAMTLLDVWLQHGDQRGQHKRWLSDAQREAIKARVTPDAATACRRPLYLRILFEECRLWPSWKPASAMDLGENTAALLQSLFDRLAEPANHGRILVESVLSYMASARHGLSENEILEIIWADPDYKKHLDEQSRRTGHSLPPEATRIPIAIWSRLRHDLNPYLAEHAAPGGVVLNFYHREVGRVAEERFLGEAGRRVLQHSRLAMYFQSERQPWWREAETSKRLTEATVSKRFPNARRAAELPWQLLREADASDPAREHSAAWDAPVALLCDMEFLEAKCAARLVFDLQEDYRNARNALPEAQAAIREEQSRSDRMARWTDEIIRYSRTWSERRDRVARGERVDGPEPVLPEPPAACRMWAEDEIDAECQRIIENPTRLDRLQAFGGFVERECYPLVEFGAKPGFVIQHAFNHAPRGPVHAEAAKIIVAITVPMMVREWPPEALYNPWPALLRTLEGHSAPVLSVSVTPDGRRAVSASADQTLRIWNLGTGGCLRTMEEGHAGAIGSVSVTPDGRRSVSASKDILRVWDLETGVCLRTLEGHGGIVYSVSMTPDGRRAVSGSLDKTVRIWDVETGTCLRTLEGHADWVSDVSATPDGRRAVSVSRDGTLRVWDLETGECLRTLEGGSRCVRVTPDGRRAVSIGTRGLLQVWDLETGACLRTLDADGRFDITPDGRRAVSVGVRGLQVSDLETGACLRTLGGLTSDAGSVVSVTPDGRRAVSGTGQRALHVWDVETGACLGIPEGYSRRVTNVSVTCNARRAVCVRGYELEVWDLERGTRVHTLKGHLSWVDSVSVLPDERRAVSASSDRTLRLWDLKTGACLCTLVGHSDRVSGVSVTPDGRRAVSASWDRTLAVWDLNAGACLRFLEGHSDQVWSVSVTPHGDRAVSASKDGTVRVWDLETGSCMRTLREHRQLATDPSLRRLQEHGMGVKRVCVTPDGRRAVAASMDATIWLWDLETGARLPSPKMHRGEVASLSVLPDGRRAMSAGYDTTVRLWDMETGACWRTFEGHGHWVTGVSVTPDGQRAVSASTDKTLRVWDLETGACLAVASGGAQWLAVAAAFAPTLVAGSEDGTVVLFHLRNVTCGPAVCTAVRAKGNWWKPCVRCPWCGQTMPVPARALQAIAERPAHPLPDSAFHDDRLRIDCASCGRSIQLNPFLVEQSRATTLPGKLVRRLLRWIGVLRHKQ